MYFAVQKYYSANILVAYEQKKNLRTFIYLAKQENYVTWWEKIPSLFKKCLFLFDFRNYLNKNLIFDYYK